MGPKVPDTDTEAELSSDEVQRAKSQPRGKTGLKLRLGVPSSQQASASQPSSEGRPLRTRNTTTPQGFQHTSAYDIYNPPVGPGRGTRNSVNTEATFVDPTALSRPGASSRRSHTVNVYEFLTASFL